MQFNVEASSQFSIFSSIACEQANGAVSKQPAIENPVPFKTYPTAGMWAHTVKLPRSSKTDNNIFFSIGRSIRMKMNDIKLND